MEAQELAKYIDHTVLKANASKKEVLQVCEEALQYGFLFRVCEPVLGKAMP